MRYALLGPQSEDAHCHWDRCGGRLRSDGDVVRSRRNADPIQPAATQPVDRVLLVARRTGGSTVSVDAGCVRGRSQLSRSAPKGDLDPLSSIIRIRRRFLRSTDGRSRLGTA